LLTTPTFVETPEVAYNNAVVSIPSYLFLEEMGVVNQPETQTLATVSKNASNKVSMDIFNDLEYGEIISCLAKYESGYNSNAIGDHGRAISVLQFWQGTFDRYCEGNIYNPVDQVRCADNMLKQDKKNIRHWTTAYKCI